MDKVGFVQPDDLGVIQYRAWIRTGLIAVCLAYATSLAAHFLLDDRGRSGEWWRILPEVSVLLVGGVAALQLRAGRLQLVGRLMVAAVWMELHSGGMIAGEFMVISIAALPVVVVGSGLFMGGTGAMILAAVSSVTYPLAVQAGALWLDTGPGIIRGDLFRMIILALTLLATGWLMRTGLSAYQDVLARARDSAARFRSLVENAPYGILLIDAHARVEATNPAALLVLGRTREQLVGASLADLLGADARDLVLGTTAEIRYRGAGGTQHLDIVSVPHPEGGGAQVMMRNQTARRAMEAQATQLGRLLDDALSEIYVIDAATLRFRFVNRGARANLGYAAEELAEREAGDINPGMTRARVAEFLRDTRRGPEAGSARARGVHVRRDGTVYPVEIQLSRGTYDDAEVVIVFALDVTDRVEADRRQEHLQHQLQHAHRLEAVGQLASGVAHEVNNVLLTIGSHVRLLEEDTADPAFLGEVRAIHAAQQRGEAITRRLFAFAQRNVQQASAFAVADLVDEVRPLLSGMLGERHQLVVEREGPSDVLADPGQVEQVLIHLVTNARDAMPDGGIVRLVLGASERDGSADGTVTVDVRDTGVGMDDVTQRRMFEPFFTTKTGGGAGLGLTMVEALVTRNNGTLEVRSSPGWGTRMRIRLPAAPLATARTSRPSPLGVPQPAGGRLLLVEDDDAARSALTRLLERGGYDVMAAGTVGAALAALDDARLDVAITDLALPDASGLDLIRQLRTTRPTLPVLLITGHIDPDVALEGIDPTKDLLIKPFASSLLLRRLSEVMRR